MTETEEKLLEIIKHRDEVIDQMALLISEINVMNKTFSEMSGGGLWSENYIIQERIDKILEWWALL